MDYPHISRRNSLLRTLYKHREAIYGHALSRLTLEHADDLSSLPID